MPPSISECGLRIADLKSINIQHSAIIDRFTEGTGLEPASDKCAVVFGTTALPVRLPFPEEFRIANCRMRICFIQQSFKIRNPKYEILSGACGRTRTYEGQS